MAFKNFIKIIKDHEDFNNFWTNGYPYSNASSVFIKNGGEKYNRNEIYQNAYIEHLWVVGLRVIFIFFLIFSVLSKFPTITCTTWRIKKAIFKNNVE